MTSITFCGGGGDKRGSGGVRPASPAPAPPLGILAQSPWPFPHLPLANAFHPLPKGPLQPRAQLEGVTADLDEVVDEGTEGSQGEGPLLGPVGFSLSLSVSEPALLSSLS